MRQPPQDRLYSYSLSFSVKTAVIRLQNISILCRWGSAKLAKKAENQRFSAVFQ
jgi:hypothetical protein